MQVYPADLAVYLSPPAETTLTHISGIVPRAVPGLEEADDEEEDEDEDEEEDDEDEEVGHDVKGSWATAKAKATLKPAPIKPYPQMRDNCSTSIAVTELCSSFVSLSSVSLSLEERLPRTALAVPVSSAPAPSAGFGT